MAGDTLLRFKICSDKIVSTEETDSYPLSRARTNSYFCNETEYFSPTDAVVEKLNHVPLVY